MNMINVTRFWLGKEFIEDEEESFDFIAFSVLKLLHQGAGLNTTSPVSMPITEDQVEFSGSPTDNAILSWVVMDLQIDIENLKK